MSSSHPSSALRSPSSDVVISVENLSKSYLIGHDGPQERYHSLRDTLVRHGKNYVRKAVDMACGRQIIQGDSVEEFWALKDVSFEVKRGEVLGIIGRNGAGKSTLLKILSRITEPTSGRVVLDGRVASLLEVGTGFHPELTGRENIFLNGAILGMSKAEIRRKFDEIVDFAGVEKFLDTPVKRYSSGMYVRLAFAVAAHLEPEILIVDEVLAVGDAEFQKKCLGKMQDVANGGRTVLFVSHSMAAIQSLCSKAVLLGRGSVIEYGKCSDVVRRYSAPEAPSGQEIARFATYIHPEFRLLKVTVNGNADHEVPIGPNSHHFDVAVDGIIATEKRLDLEVYLCDRNDTVIGFFGPAHQRGGTPSYNAGEFRLFYRIMLPDLLNSGDYYLTISLTDHNICGWADFPRAVKLVIKGCSDSGQDIDCSSGKGFFRLVAAKHGQQDGPSAPPR